jgi:hypothetical protein
VSVKTQRKNSCCIIPNNMYGKNNLSKFLHLLLKSVLKTDSTESKVMGMNKHRKDSLKVTLLKIACIGRSFVTDRRKKRAVKPKENIRIPQDLSNLFVL